MKFGYKAFNKDLTCRGYKYKRKGINKYNGPLIVCHSGFHYCTDLKDVFRYYQYKPNQIRLFSIIDYSDRTIRHDDKSVSDCIELMEEIDLTSEKICLEAVKQDGWALQYVKNQSEKICLEAVKQDRWALQYVKNQSEKICLDFIKSKLRNLEKGE